MKQGEQFSTESRRIEADKESSLARKQSAIERFIKMSGILEQPGADPEIVKEINTAVSDLSPEERATRIYEGVIAYSLERHAEKAKQEEEGVRPDPYFVSEFKLLWGDEGARRIFLEKFGEARLNLKTHRLSELGGRLAEIKDSLQGARKAYQKSKQDLILQRVKSPTAIKAAEAQANYQRKRIEQLTDDENKIINLEGYEHTRENTDVAAVVMYETLKRYHKEAAAGFAWLPSRRKLHEKVNDTIEHTGKAPLLIGPPGTGKTTQIDAVAQERTGIPAIRIPCNPGLSEEGLVYIRDIKKGEGAYDYKGTVTEAATGYEHSLSQKPAVSHGRMASLDEISQLNIDRALGPIKDIRQAKVGKSFSRFAPHEVLPGFQLAATSNIPIADERLDREFARIPTNYFEMSRENPELFEFMLAKLLREEGHFPPVDKRDISPAYQKKDIPEKERKTLQDGSTIIAEDILIENPADARHGFLYRFAGMIRAIQDSYIHGSQFNEKHLANTAVYEDYDSDGNLTIKGCVADINDKSQFPGGQMLKLKSGSSTITAEIVFKWMGGFAQSGEKDLISWLQQMLQEHIDQTSPEDGERIKAVADYFHLFEGTKRPGPIQLLTPKEIGYLSPRVPRPVYVEKPITEPEESPTQPLSKEKPKEYETRQVLLEDGTRILVKVREFILEDGNFDLKENKFVPFEVTLGRRFMVGNETFTFAGVVEDETSPYDGRLIGQLVGGEGLHKVFSPEELNLGIINEFKNSIQETETDMFGIDDFKQLFIDYWREEGCEEKHGKFVF